MQRRGSLPRGSYLVVGGLAVVHHTEPRYTKHIDIWVEPTAENAIRVMRALKRFRAPLKSVRAADFTNPQIVFQIGIEPIRIDLLTSMKGLKFDGAWAARTRARWGGQAVNVLGVADLVANKRRVGRPQDLLDVERLLPLLKKSPGRKPR